MVSGGSLDIDTCKLASKLGDRFGYDAEASRVGISHLDELLSCSEMKALFRIFNGITTFSDCGFQYPNSIHLMNKVHSFSVCDEDFKNGVPCLLWELSEFFSSSPHLLALLQCQDQIVRKEYKPELPQLVLSEWIGQDEDESMKVVRLMKGSEPLGATIAIDEESGNIVIARILKGGVADRSGLIHANDVLVSVNKVPTNGREPSEIIRQFTDYTGPITFCLIPAEFSFLHRSKRDDVFHVRAKFDYDPRYDILIPCTEAGLHFKKNDILHVMSRDDSFWWQASVEQTGVQMETDFSPTSARAGLIPSERLQKKRQSLNVRVASSQALHGERHTKGSNTSLSHYSGKRTWSRLRQSFGLIKNKDNLLLHESTLHDQSQQNKPFYEEVTPLPPPALQAPGKIRFRPLVLIGPRGIERNILKDRLIDSDPSHYGVPVPHTSREKVIGDEDGKDYHFVTRSFMESGIQRGIFLEYGEYKGNIYGTSLQAIQDVIASHLVCVLTPYPQALKLLYNAELKPYIIFIKPPPVTVSGNDLVEFNTILTVDRKMAAPLTLEESVDLSKRGDCIEAIYGHYFDYTIVSRDINEAFSELLQVADFVENKQQWVPSSWCLDG